MGTGPDAIDLAEDRGKFAEVLRELEIPAPPHGEARTIGGGAGDRRADRLPGRRPALLRARGARDGDRLRRRRARGVRPDRRRRLARPSGADRPVPGGRDRGRRRRGVRRRRRRVHRRGDGAHRGGRRALRRLVLSDPAGDAVRRGARHDRGHRDAARTTPRRRRAAEPPARRQGRADLGAGGQPARLADRAVRVEGRRGVARARGDARAHRAHDRRPARRRRRARPTRTTTGACRTRA